MHLTFYIDVDKEVHVLKRVLKDNIPTIYCMTIIDCNDTHSVIQAARSARALTSDMARVKSSNIWSYGMDVKKHGDDFGDVVVQFKDSQGGPGDIYVYFDVPVRTYRRWQSSPSKGHYFWRYIRNNFKYSKLTGDKIGKLDNAIN